MGITRKNLADTDQVLDSTEMDLDATRAELMETKHVVEQQVSTEKTLAGQAENLKAVVEETIDHTELLHAKVARKAAVEDSVLEQSNSFQQNSLERIKALEATLSGLCDYHNASYNGLKEQMGSFVAQLSAGMTQMTDTLDQINTVFAQHHKSLESSTQDHLSFASSGLSAFAQSSIMHQQTVNSRLEQVSGDLAKGVESLRSQLSNHHAKLSSWSETMQANLNNSMKSIDDFSAESLAHVQSIRDEITQQVGGSVKDLKGHQSFLDGYVESQQQASAKMTQELTQKSKQLEEIMIANVKSMLADLTKMAQTNLMDHSNDATKAATELRANIEAQVGRTEQQYTKLTSMVDDMQTQVSSFKSGYENQHHQSSQVAQEGFQAATASKDDVLSAMNTIEGSLQPQLTSMMTDSTAHVGEIESYAQKYKNVSEAFAATHSSGMSALLQQQTQAQTSVNTSAGDLIMLAHETGNTMNMQVDGNEAKLSEQQGLISQSYTDLRSNIDSYVSALPRDVPTGQTPVKKSYLYPTDFVRTEDHTSLVEKFRKTRKLDSSECHREKKRLRMEARDNIPFERPSVSETIEIEMDAAQKDEQDKENSTPSTPLANTSTSVLQELDANKENECAPQEPKNTTPDDFAVSKNAERTPSKPAKVNNPPFANHNSKNFGNFSNEIEYTFISPLVHKALLRPLYSLQPFPHPVWVCRLRSKRAESLLPAKQF